MSEMCEGQGERGRGGREKKEEDEEERKEEEEEEKGGVTQGADGNVGRLAGCAVAVTDHAAVVGGGGLQVVHR